MSAERDTAVALPGSIQWLEQRMQQLLVEQSKEIDAVRADLSQALAERDEARAAADAQAAEIARLTTKAEAYERQIVALKIDLAEATALMRATVDEAKSVAAEHDKLSDQVRQLAATIEAGIEQSAAAERAALQGVAEYDAAVARADAAEASAAAMRERCAVLVEWASLDWDNGDPRKVIAAAIRAIPTGDAGRALLADPTATAAADAYRAQQEERAELEAAIRDYLGLHYTSAKSHVRRSWSDWDDAVAKGRDRVRDAGPGR